MTKKLLGLAALLMVLGAPASAQMGRANGKFAVPEDNNRRLAPNLDFIGIAVDTASAAGTVTGNRNSAASNVRQFFIGEGVFYDILMSTGATTDWTACWDSAGTTLAAGVLDPWTIGSTMTVVGYVPGHATLTHTINPGGQVPPVRIRKGLLCKSTLGTILGGYLVYFEQK